ncbi:MAG: zinc ribbon domain-containing protein [Planctomycetota bacterium]|jgi:RNA polymerase subunit RPABC4/transcription elongation factor Spt4
MEEEKINPGHRGMRDTLRVVGPIVGVIGLIFIIIGLVSFFSSMGSFGPPKYFWCAFVGGPILIVGIALTKFGYMGKVARYMAGEIAPVGKDTFNYMADGTKDGVKTLATAIGSGLGAGIAGASGAVSGGQETKVRCHKCNELVDEDAKFCNECGVPLSKSKPCPQCSELNDGDAKFCDNCGHNFG